VIWADPIKKRATIFGWISNATQDAEFTAFGFYIAVILVLAGVGRRSNAGCLGALPDRGGGFGRGGAWRTCRTRSGDVVGVFAG
jgi:hypothetical protein